MRVFVRATGKIACIIDDIVHQQKPAMYHEDWRQSSMSPNLRRVSIVFA